MLIQTTLYSKYGNGIRGEHAQRLALELLEIHLKS